MKTVAFARYAGRLARTLAIGVLLSMTAMTAMTASGCGTTTAGAESGGQRARAMVAAGATLVDVRTPGEYASGHVEGATNIPVDELEGRMSEIASDRPVVVYCRSGARSSRAAAALEARGYEVFDLGPMTAW